MTAPDFAAAFAEFVTEYQARAIAAARAAGAEGAEAEPELEAGSR